MTKTLKKLMEPPQSTINIPEDFEQSVDIDPELFQFGVDVGKSIANDEDYFRIAMRKVLPEYLESLTEEAE